MSILLLEDKNIMLYTTYFARLKTLPETITPISICGKAPAWFTGAQYKKLAPKWSFFSKWKETRDNHFYVSCFNEQVLSHLNPLRTYDELMVLAGTQDIALVCYEKPEDFCHRHLVANWFRENGFQIKEWEPTSGNVKAHKQLTLDELRKMHGTPVYCPDKDVYGIIHVMQNGIFVNTPLFMWHDSHNVPHMSDVFADNLKLYKEKL